MTDDLVAWIRVQLDEDERRAPLVAEIMRLRSTTAPFAARLQRDIEAKRRILDLHRPGSFPDCRGCGDDYPCETAKLIALPYADRPGYRSEWAPSDT